MVTPAEPRPAPHPVGPADEIATGGDFERQVEHSAASSASVIQRKWQPVKPQGFCASRADPGLRPARTHLRPILNFSY